MNLWTFQLRLNKWLQIKFLHSTSYFDYLSGPKPTFYFSGSFHCFHQSQRKMQTEKKLYAKQLGLKTTTSIKMNIIGCRGSSYFQIIAHCSLEVKYDFNFFFLNFYLDCKERDLIGNEVNEFEADRERKKVFLVVTLSERNRLKDKKLFFFENKFPSTSNNHISRKIFLLSTDVEKMSFSSFFFYWNQLEDSKRKCEIC